MFDLGWTELMVVAVVAILVVGPRDLPKMLRTFGNFVGQIRRMAREFQGQFDDAMKEAELDDVKRSIENVNKLNPAQAVKDGLNDALNPIKKSVDDVSEAVKDDYDHEWVKSLNDEPAAAKPKSAAKPKAAGKAKTPSKSKTAAKAAGNGKTPTTKRPAKSPAAKAAASTSATGSTAASKAGAVKPAAKPRSKPAAAKAANKPAKPTTRRTASKPAATRKPRAAKPTATEANT